MEPRLVADAAVDLAVAVLYALVGVRLSRRRLAPEAKSAQIGFSVWWWGLSATGVLAALGTGLYLTGSRNVLLFELVGYSTAVAFTVGLAGLVHYFAYLFLGPRPLLVPIVGVYLAYNVLQSWQLARAPPDHLELQGWRVAALSLAPASATFLIASFALLLLPPLAGALAYLGLLRKAQGPSPRWRITLVSTSILAWLVSVLIISQPALLAGDAWQASARGVILASAVLIEVAYRPPRWARERWGIQAAA